MITFTQLGKMGRDGNQLFQMATVIALALRNNDQYKFPLWDLEPYFNLHGCFSNNISPTLKYQEPFFHYQEIQHKNGTLDINGYFQSWKYFEDKKSEIIRLLTPNYNVQIEPGLCSIHVRRGDYLKFEDCHPVLGNKYYHKAIEISNCKKFLVFSDDISWCKDNFKGNMFEFSEGNAPHVDLALMAKKCESNIIANSSFSWWGAYLNQCNSKKIIAPSKWFGPKLNMHNVKDLLPNEWIRIDA